VRLSETSLSKKLNTFDNLLNTFDNLQIVNVFNFLFESRAHVSRVEEEEEELYLRLEEKRGVGRRLSGVFCYFCYLTKELRLCRRARAAPRRRA
jgi:hypothetical protein